MGEPNTDIGGLQDGAEEGNPRGTAVCQAAGQTSECRSEALRQEASQADRTDGIPGASQCLMGN